MKTRHVLITVLTCLALAVVFTAFPGCQTATQKAVSVKNDVIEQTVIIESSARAASAKITDADSKIVTAIEQPGNPPTTVGLLTGAHADLGEAADALKPIAPAVSVVVEKSTKAAQLTRDAEAKLADERDHWLGYKTRKWLLIIGVTWLLLGIGGALLTAKCSPVGLAYTIGKEIIRLLPLSNPFSWLRKSMGGDAAQAPVVVNVNTK